MKAQESSVESFDRRPPPRHGHSRGRTANRAVTLLVASLFASGAAHAGVIFEGFENATSIFAITSTRGIRFDPHNTEHALEGGHALKTFPSSCRVNCFGSYRVDLTYNFDQPTFVDSVEFNILEDSLSGREWGGHYRVLYQKPGAGFTALPFVAGRGNHRSTRPFTWFHYVFDIQDTVSTVQTRVEDLTNLTLAYVDGVRINTAGGADPVPEPRTTMLFGMGLIGLWGVTAWRGRRKTPAGSLNG